MISLPHILHAISRDGKFGERIMDILKSLFMLSIAVLLMGCTSLERAPSPTPSLPILKYASSTETQIASAASQVFQPTATLANETASTTISVPPAGNPEISPTSTATPQSLADTPVPTPSRTPTVSIPSQTLTLAPDAWKSMPVVPTLSDRAIVIYQRGLAMGNNPHSFSKIGDGEISGVWFFTDFDSGPQYYNLGEYTDLQEVISYFPGSFKRWSQAAKRGFNTSRVLDPSLADHSVCNPGETPLNCELRLNQPSFAIISMGTNQIWTPDVFSVELRKIIDGLIERGTVPILSTKGDNLEGDNRINIIIAGLAYEYDLPLWNFWLAIQPLPDHGLQADLEHLTYARSFFNDPDAMNKAWPVRNLTALQVLKAMMERVEVLP
jgi:hypothetical protein